MSEPSSLDDQLAEFTERLLSGEVPDELEPTMQDQEFFELQTTVVRLKAAFEKGQPDEIMARRIKNNLIAEWKKAGLEAEASPFPKWWPRRKVSNRWTAMRQWQFVALAVAVVAVLVFMASFSNFSAMPAPGAAEGGAGVFLPVAILLGLVAVAGLVWALVRRKR